MLDCLRQTGYFTKSFMISLGKDQETTRSRFNSSTVARLGRLGGPVLALAVYLLLPDGGGAGLSPEARATAGIGTLMAVWWMTEALPLPATSLLPIVLFPLAGAFSIKQAAAPYAHPLIFLFMGGFMIALAIERWNLHRRIALLTVLAVGTQPDRMIGGFMIATAFLSMWISNTATTIMMLPIGLSVVTLLANKRSSEAGVPAHGVQNQKQSQTANTSNFAVCLMLGIAYAASIGGIGTIVGTPPNVFLVGFLKQKGIEIDFFQWMKFGLPLVVVFLYIAWYVLTRFIYPVGLREISGGRQMMRGELHKLGGMSRGEWTVLSVFLLTAAGWVLRKPLTDWTWLVELVPAINNLNDSIIALTGALLLFIIPVDSRQGQFALDWDTAKKLPWGVLLLLGGGFSLAAAVTSSGLDQWIGLLLEGLSAVPTFVLVAVVTVVVILLTEITSNTATSATFLPILFGVAVVIGVDPKLLVIPAVLAASCAFMLPVATPPNAIVFGSGHVTIAQMVKAGVWLNMIGFVLIMLLMYVVAAPVLGVEF